MLLCHVSRRKPEYRPGRFHSMRHKNDWGAKPMRLPAGFFTLSALALALFPSTASAAEMRGVTATEIKIGQTMP